MILFTAVALLFFAFMTHIVWWRVKRPAHTTSALLLLFIGFFIIAISALSLSFIEVMRLGLLYISCALSYIILYSAIEQQSPTLAMIHYIDLHGEKGCDDESLAHSLCTKSEIMKRLTLMEQSDWLLQKNMRWYLTKKGRRLAYLFDYAAKLFGLKIGG